MRYQWIIFDADGTLFDYDEAERIALEKSFFESGESFRPEYLERYAEINAKMWKDFEQSRIALEDLKPKRFDILFKEMELSLDAIVFSQLYLKHLSNVSSLLPHAAGIVKSLATTHQLLVLTNGLIDVQIHRIKGSTIREYFYDVCISEEVGVAKPDPKIFKIAFEQMGNPQKENVLMVGDSLTADIKGGVEFGIDTCWLNRKNQENNFDFKPTYEIRELTELNMILL